MNINIMQKEYDCPICDARFKAPRARLAKLNLIGVDNDLRPYHEGLDAICYEVIVCTSCGFASTHENFMNFSPKYADSVRRGLNEVALQKVYLTELTPEEAIDRFISAIQIAKFREASNSEYFYLYSRLAWLYRTFATEEALENEYLALRNAYKHLEEAYKSGEEITFDMDNAIVIFTLGEMARRVGDYEKANLYIGKSILDPTSNDELRNRAKTTKVLIAKDIEKAHKVIDEHHNAEVASVVNSKDTKKISKTKRKK